VSRRRSSVRPDHPPLGRSHLIDPVARGRNKRGVTAFTGHGHSRADQDARPHRKGSNMIKNRELALIPDSALALLDVPATAPEPRSSTSRRSASSRTAAPRTVRRPRVSRRTTRRAEGTTPA
jgi:hypothetical protein